MRRDQLPPHRSATYVMPRWKAVYVSVNKAACTSLKWLVADLQGERPEQFHGSLSREVGRAMTIHKRRLWERTPMLHKLPAAELAAISPDDGWFIFAVVRHPAARVWSAWQSKLLLREPAWAQRFGAEPWFPRVPSTTEEIGEDFAKFVAFIEQEPEHAIARNRHVAPQHRLLVPDRMPYSRIYGTREIPVLLEDLERHLREQGWDGTLELPKSNETPLRPIRSFFTDDVRASIRRVYREDFERFDYEDDLPEGLHRRDRYDDAALAEVTRLIERAERIDDVIARAREFQHAATEAETRARDAERRFREAEARRPTRRARRLAGRARRRLRHVLRPA
jgi:hypothetical protein